MDFSLVEALGFSTAKGIFGGAEDSALVSLRNLMV
jgi:hypothetical protein